MTWDFFISHASEDKPLIAAPLAHYLDSVSFSTWYDDFCRNVGDSLTDAISKGLQSARYGIVTLSPDFFRNAALPMTHACPASDRTSRWTRSHRRYSAW